MVVCRLTFNVLWRSLHSVPLWHWVMLRTAQRSCVASKTVAEQHHVSTSHVNITSPCFDKVKISQRYYSFSMYMVVTLCNGPFLPLYLESDTCTLDSHHCQCHRHAGSCHRSRHCILSKGSLALFLFRFILWLTLEPVYQWFIFCFLVWAT